MSKCHWNHGPSGTSVGVGAADRQPSDLRLAAAEHLAPEHPGQHLSAEAQAEHRHVGVDRSTHEPRLTRHERLRVVEGRELGAERHDQVVRGGVDLAVVDVDPERLDVGSVVVEPLGDEPRRGGVFVLQDQRAEGSCSRVVRGAHAEPPPMGDAVSGRDDDSSDSTSSETWRMVPARRATISASSSSVVVKGGANSVWSPA